MKNSGVLLSDESRGRRVRRLAVAAGALMLLAIFPLAAARAADEEFQIPITAADAARMMPFGGSAGSAATPAAIATPSTSNAGTAAAPSIVEAAPAKAQSASEPPPIAAQSAPVASAPVKLIPASEPAPVAKAAPVANPVTYSSTSPSDSIGAEEEEALKLPTYTVPAVPSIDNPGNDAVITSPPGMQEIPQAMPEEDPVAMVPPNTLPQMDDLNSYMKEDFEPGMGGPRDFLPEGVEISPIGLEMRQSHCRLKTGETAEGLLILNVVKNSAAAKAGLRSYKRAGHNVLEGLAIGAAMVFPPAILAVPVIDYTEVGESYDVIIGIDGARVSTIVDFEYQMHSIQPGQIVYFNVVRSGKRIQIPVPVPALSTSASN